MKLTPLGHSVRVRTWSQGAHVRGCAHLQLAGGAPVVLQFAVDLRPIAHAIANRVGCSVGSTYNGSVRVSGFPGNVWRAAKKIGKSKLIKKLRRAIKKTLKSKYVKYTVYAAAVVYPPVGIPAVAAYTAANATLDQIETGEKVASAAVHAVRSGSRETVVQHAPEIRATQDQRNRARAGIRQIAARARAGDPQAKAAARIFAIVYESRQKMQRAAAAIDRSIPGILVTHGGKILPGRYLPAVAGR
jgi:hypothetical protein